MLRIRFVIFPIRCSIPGHRTENQMNIDNQNQTCPQQAKGVTFREVGGEAVLLNLNTGTYYGLNEVGTFVWQQIDGTHNLEQIADAICAHYEIDRHQATADARRLAGELLDAGLVYIELSE